MRIAILTNAYPPQMRGGAGRIAEKQVELLRSAGHEVEVWRGSLDWNASPAPIRLLFHVLDLVYRFPALQAILAWKPDVLITHNLTGCGWMNPSLIQKKGVRWIHVLHDVQLFEPSGSLASAERITPWQRIWSALRRPVFSRPDFVLSPTQWLLDQHRRRGWFEEVATRVLPNPAPPMQERSKERHTVPRVLFVGRFSPDKGSFLLRDLVSQMDVPLEWHFVGSDTERLRDQPIASGSSVTIHGVLEESAILGLMQRMDVLLVPSQIEENQPTVILEALACGLPVIASQKGGIPETLGVAGKVVHGSGVESWKKAIHELLDSRLSGDVDHAMRERGSFFSAARHLIGLEEALNSKRKT